MNTTETGSSQELLHVGVDLAKNVFQVAYKDEHRSRMINKQLSRHQFEEFLTNSKRKLMVVFEACGSAHYWGRFCRELGHSPVMIPAEMTNSMTIGNKDDRNDAHSIWQASFLPDLKTVSIRSESNQVEGMLLKSRDFLLKIDCQLNNFLKSMLYELGVPCKETSFDKTQIEAELLIKKARESDKEWADQFSAILKAMYEIRNTSIECVSDLTDKVNEAADTSDLAQKLQTIPYVGKITSLAFANVMVDADQFQNGRQFADYCGEAPYHSGTGGKVSVKGISRKGNKVLKRVLYEAASSLYCRVKVGLRSKSRRYYQSDWISKLVDKKAYKVAVCAIANKMCRIAWAVAASPDGKYDQDKTTLVSILNKSDEQFAAQKDQDSND